MMSMDVDLFRELVGTPIYVDNIYSILFFLMKASEKEA